MPDLTTSNPSQDPLDPNPGGSGSRTSFPATSPTDNLEWIGFSFLQEDPAHERLLFDLTAVPGRNERYCFTFGACNNPACDCRSLDVWLEPLRDSTPAGKTTHLRLMLDTHEVQTTDPEQTDDRQLAHELAARMTPRDWLTALHFYRSDKVGDSEPADASDLEIPFPDQWLADPAAMIQYQDVFRYAEHMRFEHEGKRWVVFERYCSEPNCTCQEVLLDLAPFDEGGPPERERLVSEKDVTGLRFDYSNNRLTVRKQGPPGSPSPLKLFAALEAADPDLKSRLRRRQNVLRQLHARARRQQHLTPASPVRALTKVGRNEPCPCGSGRKYKKCCGQKPA